MTRPLEQHATELAPKPLGTFVFLLILASTLLFGARSVAASESAESDHGFPWQGERFVYSLRVNDAEAMRAALKTGRIRFRKGQPYVPLGLTVRSLGFFDNVYPVDDRADTFMNPRTMRPYQTEKHFQESGEFRTYAVQYRHDQFRARVLKRKKDWSQKGDVPIPGTTHDMMTWLYDLRSREMSPGKRFRYFVYDGWKMSHVYMKIVGREELYTPAGWFKAWKFEFVRKVVVPKRNEQGGEATAPVLAVKEQNEHSGHFWLSRDENHLPLRVTIPTSFGSGEAILLDYRRDRVPD